MNFIEKLTQRLQGEPRRIVFPEGGEEIIREAASRLKKTGLIQPVLLGLDPVDPDHQEFETTDHSNTEHLERYASAFAKERDMPVGAAKRIIRGPLGFASAMVALGDADGMVAGLSHPTEEVLLTAEMIIGLSAEAATASSFFLMEVPGFNGGEEGALIFADPAVNPDPDINALASLAVVTAQSAKAILNWLPRVAMLSFSTHGSADHPCVTKIAEATKLAQSLAPDLAIDGEIQLDTALVEAIAKRKMIDPGPVAGRANILIFPDLNSANIGSKLVQQLAGAASYGPVLQGFKKPISDLSRGATVDDVIGAALIVAIRCNEQE